MLKEGGCMLALEINLITLMRHLEDWGFHMSLEYNTNLFLASLPPSYNGFIVCYLMTGVHKPIRESFTMLTAMRKAARCWIQSSRLHSRKI
jgi:hypothetical protein